MVTVRIQSTGDELDVIGDLTYVKQVDDIGDISKVMSSYTWQMTFPKSPNNTRILRGLGIAGSTSSVPYDKIICQVLYNGQLVEPNGNLIITETANDYKGHVKAGIIDFIQDISNDKISDVIDLSSLNHVNNVGNIIASFTANLPYKYIVAYYNGQLLPDVSGVTNLNPFALVPSINVKYLWDAIFAHYGWTYSGNFDLSDVWMTYPEAIGYETDGGFQVLNAAFTAQTRTSSTSQLFNPTNTVIDTDYVVFNLFQQYVIQETGNYRLKAKAEGTTIYKYGVWLELQQPMLFGVYVNGVLVQSWVIADGNNEIQIDITAPTGTIITIMAKAQPIPSTDFVRHEVDWATLTIDTLGIQTIDFSKALIKLKVKDFFKEIMIRNALTPFVDVENKAIRFRPLDERLTAPAVDWSNKYAPAGRSEKYIYNQYAQKNIIKHKYNAANEDWADGVIVIDNANQPEEKDLYASFSYAPEETLVEYHGSTTPVYYVQNFRMFDVEVSQDPDTEELVANYKQLKDRFYFIKAEQRVDDIYVLGELAEEFPLAVYSEVFGDIVNTKYANISQLVQSAKIITVDLALSLADVVMLDFYKRYYFEQEKAYFILNRVTFKPGSLSQSEFVKINR